LKILIENLGKKFNREWIFRNIHLELQIGNAYALTGSNGSGKSTFLQIIAGILPYSTGKILYQNNGKWISEEHIYQYLALATPYLELIEEFTLLEMVKFHTRFKKFKPPMKPQTLIEILGLSKAQNKELKYFSSGMKQRVKLGLAFYSDCPILLLDEPTSNLDAQGIDWYKNEILSNLQNRLLVIASNQADEYNFCCKETIDVMKYKF
jgi:ABC-type multidrug transport system ATPase subunit